ncbi:MAG: ATP-binding protein, partial [Spirochaetaceae bacterium]|nr:ATP-binding protein [Spirochaetaceae bacterium]
MKTGEKYRMDERLIVKNFLCLKDVDIEVKDFLVLIGPQAAGKSLCAKLLYFFRTIFEEITLYQMKVALGTTSDFNKFLSDKFESFFPKTYWERQEFYIEYKRDEMTISKIVKEKNKELILYLNQIVMVVSHEIKKRFQRIVNTDNDLIKIKEMLNTFSDKPIYPPSAKNIFIPAGRSFFSLLQNNIFRFLRTSNNIDPFLAEFGIIYEDIRQASHDLPVEVRNLIHAILKGDYVPTENLVQLADGSKITLELLSSGQQEALPLVLVFASIISLRLESHELTNIYVEEPEAHLFPDAQEQMSRLISFLRYNANHEVTFAITTHSPYILAAFNNLIKAGNIVKQNPSLKDAVCVVIPESMHIDIERFSAYSLKDGKATSIIDEETSLIDPRAIDAVSEDIMEIF